MRRRLPPSLKDRLLRTLAEMENLRKRTAREVTDARALRRCSFARDMLAVADNMRRALDAVSPELRASAEAGVKALIDGVELTERELLKALEKNGVRQFTPRGEKFDPNVHQAMFEVPNPSVPAGSVVEVVQPGYMIGERVLRPAMVGVSKGGPKTAPRAPVGQRQHRRTLRKSSERRTGPKRRAHHFSSTLSRTVRRRAKTLGPAIGARRRRPFAGNRRRRSAATAPPAHRRRCAHP